MSPLWLAYIYFKVVMSNCEKPLRHFHLGVFCLKYLRNASLPSNRVSISGILIVLRGIARMKKIYLINSSISCKCQLQKEKG